MKGRMKERAYMQHLHRKIYLKLRNLPEVQRENSAGSIQSDIICGCHTTCKARRKHTWLKQKTWAINVWNIQVCLSAGIAVSPPNPSPVARRLLSFLFQRWGEEEEEEEVVGQDHFPAFLSRACMRCLVHDACGSAQYSSPLFVLNLQKRKGCSASSEIPERRQPSALEWPLLSALEPSPGYHLQGPQPHCPTPPGPFLGHNPNLKLGLFKR